MDLSVIIPTYNRSEDLKRLLNSILDQNEFLNEIIVVVGPDDFLTFEMLKYFNLEKLKILKATKKSLIHSLNLGISFAQGDIICLLDDDVVLPVDWAIKIKKAFLDDKYLGAYGGRDYIMTDEEHLNSPSLSKVVGKFMWNGKIIGNHHCGVLNSPTEVDVLKGVNLSFRKALLIPLKIEPLLEGYGAEICSEVDICMRIKRRGYRVIYDNENFVYHYTSPRIEGDDRNRSKPEVLNKKNFNYGLVISKYRPFYENIFFFLRSFFKGDRNNPGIIWSIILFPQKGFSVFPLLLSKSVNLLKGILAGLKLKLM